MIYQSFLDMDRCVYSSKLACEGKILVKILIIAGDHRVVQQLGPGLRVILFPGPLSHDNTSVFHRFSIKSKLGLAYEHT